MKLIVLGSGTCVPSAQRCSPGYYLETEDTTILIDCGSGVLRQLDSAGKDFSKLDAVFITHAHPDHIADLLPLVHALLAAPGLTIRKPIPVFGPPEVGAFIGTCIFSLMRRIKTLPIVFHEAGDKIDIRDIAVSSSRTVHSENSFAYRFEQGERSVVITGDSDYDRGLVEFSMRATLLVADCSFPDEEKVAGHMVPRECGLLAKESGVRTLILSHIYPSHYPETERLKECREVYDGTVVLAEDLMEFDV